MLEKKWKNLKEAQLSTSSLELLFYNEIPAIRISNFADSHECLTLLEPVKETDDSAPLDVMDRLMSVLSVFCSAPVEIVDADKEVPIQSQLSFHLFVQTPKDGGERIVYNKMWNPTHQRVQGTHSHGYNRQLVEGVDRIEIKPKVGDLILLNTLNFHEMKDWVGEQFTLSSFISRCEDERLILWG